MSFIITNDFDSTSNSSLSLDGMRCSGSPVGMYVLLAIALNYNLFILPVSVFVLYLGFQQWKQQHLLSGATMTHSDFFNYNTAGIELLGAFGYTFFFYSSYTHVPVMMTLGVFLCSFVWPAQILFPIVTCAERYLAVVHPITYRGLRQASGVRIRNIITGCIWLICFVWGAVFIPQYSRYYKYVIAAFVLIPSLIVTVFCSLCVLHVLIRPRPGNVGSGQVDRSKQRAVRTILIIMGVLWCRFCGNVVTVAIKFSTQLNTSCVAESLTLVVLLPSSLVLPLLFLQRAGKLPKC